MPNYGGRSVAAASGLDLSGAKDGILCKFGNQISTFELQGIPGMKILHGNAREGNPMFEVESWLGRELHMDLSKTGDIAIFQRAALFIPRRIVMTLARGVPTTIKARFFTGFQGRGELLWDVPAAEWQKLTDDIQVVEYVLPTARRSFDYLHLLVDTANDVPFRVSTWIFGETLISSDIRGRGF
ncbi:hypothetical protein [Methylobacterium sp. WL19]|uniref:hypothetical protein n=1 Tax=Methylobacterium sp. WL19 TaxID=2603896 RepID=UPI0011C7E65C|nr:hypothetical protein [Methylobacterium sp. WL19]TXN33878.1 hypothetical protein FV220_00045 [Methylobacterium sp. WL19]